MFTELVFLLQILQDAREELGILAAHFAHGFAAARGLAVFILGGVESGLVHFETLFTCDIARDLKRQAVGCIKIEGALAVEYGFPLRRAQGGVLFTKFREQVLQMCGARFNGACKADFFTRQVIEDRAAALFQFGIERTIRCNHSLRHFGKEGFMQSDLGAEARPASDDHARHIIAPHIARHNAIGDEERSRANMIADDAIRREIGKHFFFGVTRE